MSVSCKFNGRLGNILINMCQVIAYCKRYNLQWWFPTGAWACTDGIVPITVQNTGEQPQNPTIYTEPHDLQGHPYYHDIPYMDNVEFHGYYQSFKYFDEYRRDILDVFNFPSVIEYGAVGVHCRFGDCIAQPDGFPIAPWKYYWNAMQYMISAGRTHFRIFSDTRPMCMEHFTQDNYPGCTFEFRDGYSDVEDFVNLAGCEHIITARSTFSLMAGWFNRNPDKVVLVPSINHKWWAGQNRNLLDTQFITQIDW